MSFWNPWREVRELRAEMEAAYARADTIIEGLKSENRDLSVKLKSAEMQRDIFRQQMKSMHRRDPKTGRILPRGQ